MNDSFNHYSSSSSVDSPAGQAQQENKKIELGDGRIRLVGFFPGLGSRYAYKNTGIRIFSSKFDDVSNIYH